MLRKPFLFKLLIMFSLIPLAIQAKTPSVVDFRGAYLRPTSSILRQIYGEAWFDFGIEANYTFYNYFMGFLGLDIIYNEGRSIGLCEPTDITIFPISLGLKVTTYCRCFQPYVGIGPKFIFTWIENDTFSLQRHVNFYTTGGVVNAGVYWWFCDSTALSAFIDYTFAWKRFPCNPCPNITNHNLDLSYLMIGLSLGGSF